MISCIIRKLFRNLFNNSRAHFLKSQNTQTTQDQSLSMAISIRKVIHCLCIMLMIGYDLNLYHQQERLSRTLQANEEQRLMSCDPIESPKNYGTIEWITLTPPNSQTPSDPPIPLYSPRGPKPNGDRKFLICLCCLFVSLVLLLVLLRWCKSELAMDTSAASSAMSIPF